MAGDKRASPDDDYARGAITRVRMVDFMTYRECEFQPGPRLNLVLGPNGSGKSSIVCAIALGLGAKPSALGRAENESGFVRTGCDSGSAEITLYGGGEKFDFSSLPSNDNVASSSSSSSSSSTEEGTPHKKKQRIGGKTSPSSSSSSSSSSLMTGALARKFFAHPWSDLVVRRLISRKSGSTYTVNGKRATASEVRQCVAKFNINVESLLSVLAQDRVSNFASILPPALLVEVEKSLGNPALHDQHEQLVEMSSEVRRKEQAIAQVQKVLDENIEKNDMVKRDVVRFRQMQKVLEEIKLIEAKLPFAKREEKKAGVEKMKREVADAKEKLEKIKKQVAPERMMIAEAKADAVEASAKQVEAQGLLTDVEKHCSQAAKNLRRSIAAYDDVLGMLETNASNHKRYSGKIEHLEKVINGVQAEIVELQTKRPSEAECAEFRDQLNKLAAEKRKRTAERKENENRKRDLEHSIGRISVRIQNAEKHLTQLSKVMSSRIANAKKSNEFFPGLQWLLDIKKTGMVNDKPLRYPDAFVGPFIYEANIEDKLAADYLNHLIPESGLFAFTAGCTEDQRLIRQAAVERRIKVSVVVIDGYDSSDPTYNPNRVAVNGGAASGEVTDLMKQYAVPSYLDDRFDAPAIMKAMVDELYRLSNVACGSRGTDEMFGKIASKNSNNGHDGTGDDPSLHFPSLITPRALYTRVRGRNGKHTFKVVKLKKNWMLEPGSTQEENAEREKQMNSISEWKAEKKVLMGKMEEMVKSVREIQGEERRLEKTFREIKGKLGNGDEAIKNLEKIQTQKMKEMEKWQKMIMDMPKEEEIRNDIAAAIQKVKKAIDKVVSNGKDRALVTACNIWASSRRVIAGNRHEELRSNAEEIAEKFRAKREEYEEKVNAYEAAKAELKAMDKELSRSPISQEMRRAFNELPDEYEKLTDMINMGRAKADSTVSTNPEVVRAYEERCRQIEAEKKEVARNEIELAELKDRVEDLRSRWMPSIEELSRRVDMAFGDFFSSAHCQGEVKLSVPEDINDFANYGMSIKVKFRAADALQELSQTLQSGGEKSLTTMIFLLSLQDVTYTPFRIVDEINQGLDKQNERTLMDLARKTASAPGAPQYFIITPKLLENLRYDHSTTVLVVYSGFFDKPQGNDFDPVRYTQSQRDPLTQ